MLKYAIGIGLVALFLGGSWAVVDLYANRAYDDYAAKEHGLQVDLARAAMQSSFQQILRESAILASFSFSEFEKGQRGLSSMGSLLDVELATYPEEMTYVYFRGPAKPFLSRSTYGGQLPLEALSRGSVEAWQLFAGREGPLVVPSYDGGPDPFFMVFHPVRVDVTRHKE